MSDLYQQISSEDETAQMSRERLEKEEAICFRHRPIWVCVWDSVSSELSQSLDWDGQSGPPTKPHSYKHYSNDISLFLLYFRSNKCSHDEQNEPQTSERECNHHIMSNTSSSQSEQQNKSCPCRQLNKMVFFPKGKRRWGLTGHNKLCKQSHKHCMVM